MAKEIGNKEKFLKLVSDKPTDTIERAKKRIENREIIREFQKSTLRILERIEKIENQLLK